jgi:hypothetical protein
MKKKIYWVTNFNSALKIPYHTQPFYPSIKILYCQNIPQHRQADCLKLGCVIIQQELSSDWH